MNVAIIHEDLEMGNRANRLCHSGKDELGAGTQLNLELWNFQILDVAKLREQAIFASARADLIVVATHGYEELPLEVLSWVEGWVSKRESRSGALVALFDGFHPQAGARAIIQSHLQDAARRSGLHFLTPASPKAETQCLGSIRAKERAA